MNDTERSYYTIEYTMRGTHDDVWVAKFLTRRVASILEELECNPEAIERYRKSLEAALAMGSPSP